MNLFKTRSRTAKVELPRSALVLRVLGLESPSTPTTLDLAGVLSPADARKRVLAEIARRQGQGKFRDELLRLFVGRCAITGCSVEAVLEAAHILPHRGVHTNDAHNGLLLRADIHTLFDLGLLGIDPASLLVTIDPKLRGTSYAELEGRAVRLPDGEDPDAKRTLLVERARRASEDGDVS